MVDLLKISISEIGDTITGKTPLSESPDDFGDTYMFVTPSDDLDNKTIFKTNRYLSEIGVKKLKNKLLPPNSILVSCIGSAMGKIAMNKSFCITNQQINSIIVNQKYDADYLYYNLKNNYAMLRNASSGSTALPMLNKTDFDQLEILIHNDKIIQQKIASVLSSLDAKIELNNRINAELEAMAKTLYDYRFVQFDFPDENGNPYKSSGGAMEYNAELKREIPKGWEVKKLGKVLKTALGGTPSTDEQAYWKNATIPWLSSGEIASFPIIQSDQFITQKGIENSAAVLLPKGSVVISIVRYIRPSILSIDACTNQSVVGIYETEKLKNTYIYPTISKEVPKLMAMRTGAQQPHINKGAIDNIQIFVPSDEVLTKYYKFVDPLYNQITNIALQNQQLAELRDWLLPMLMNGQVKVMDDTVTANGKHR